MGKITKFLDELNDEELSELEKDIKSGTIQKFLEQKREYYKIKDKLCSTCGNTLNEECLVLIFGDPKINIRKKAYFCGTDCLEYFLNRNIKKKNIKK